MVNVPSSHALKINADRCSFRRFGQADVESDDTSRDGTGIGVTVGNGAVVEDGEEMDMELDSEDEEGKDAKGDEAGEDTAYMSGVEMDGNGL